MELLIYPVLALAVFFYLYTLVAIHSLLRRQDLDSSTKLLWAFVLVFVPFAGLYFYETLAPKGAKSRPFNPASDVSGTPWEDDPGHTS